MCLKLLIVSIALRGVISIGRGTPTCPNTDDGTGLCSFIEASNGAAIPELLQSMMSMRVDRKGLKQFIPNRLEYPKVEPGGPIGSNEKLDENSERLFNFLSGPESISIVDNFLYAAARDAIYKVDLRSGNHTVIFNGNENCAVDGACSRPLGLRIRGNQLLVADALKGLIEINLTTGESRVHLAVGSPIEGEPLLFPDDIDVDWEKQIVYMSDGSTKWPLEYWAMIVLEMEPSSRCEAQQEILAHGTFLATIRDISCLYRRRRLIRSLGYSDPVIIFLNRIIRYDMKSGKADVFAKNIRFANGVQISHDKKFLLVNELSARRILKYPLDSAVPASGEPFTKLLPGNPDNIRPSLSGGYWVAMAMGRPNGSRNLLDELQTRPDLSEKLGNSALSVGGLVRSIGVLLNNTPLRDLGHKVATGGIIMEAIPGHGCIVELDVDGNIVQTLQSSRTFFLTEVCEREDGLYCGSYQNSFLLKVPRSTFRNP
ncbi:adipocyte plasma membrane-associated protein [Galendromus occidentalis]|uniref:Adipocyte plasma membrane-associated protein n=1 Tax=Galendromus occidentalis TaxID=34638 RepID=A0AAJ7L4W1_9ACAR|nr:adipocyte plasma membrane-associated protein [Galendromus occidentalis]